MLSHGSCEAQEMTSETLAVPLPGDTFDRAMAAHLDVVERRVRRLYVRPRALFAEAVVAALIDGAVSEFPAAAWDVEMPLSTGRQPVRIQVKCSGERAPQSPEKIRPPDWGRLTPPKSAKDPLFGVLRAGFNCDVFVFARHEGRDIAAGWHFYVLPEWTVTSAVGINPIVDLRRVTSLGAVRCDPGDSAAGSLKLWPTGRGDSDEAASAGTGVQSDEEKGPAGNPRPAHRAPRPARTLAGLYRSGTVRDLPLLRPVVVSSRTFNCPIRPASLPPLAR